MRSIGVLLGRMRHAGQIRIKFSFGGETRYAFTHYANTRTRSVNSIPIRVCALGAVNGGAHSHPPAHRAKPFTKPVVLEDVKSAVRELFHRPLSIFFVAAKDEVRVRAHELRVQYDTHMICVRVFTRALFSRA